jgi:transposase
MRTHLAWFVIEAIEELDVWSFYAAYTTDAHGRASHDPRMMLTPLAYAYSVGERSSRGIERCCREDVAFRVICGNRPSSSSPWRTSPEGRPR